MWKWIKNSLGITDSYSLLIFFFKKIVSILNLICKICSLNQKKKIVYLGQYTHTVNIVYQSNPRKSVLKYPPSETSTCHNLRPTNSIPPRTFQNPNTSFPHIFPPSFSRLPNTPLIKTPNPNPPPSPLHPRPLSVSKYLLFSLPIQTQ